MKNKWTEMSLHCNKFGGFYTRVVRNKRSGTTQEDWKTEAFQLFQQHIGCTFSYFVAFEVLQKSEQCSLYTTRDQKTVQNSSKVIENEDTGTIISSEGVIKTLLDSTESFNDTESLVEQVPEINFSSFQRPIGRKAEKDQSKTNEHGQRRFIIQVFASEY